MSSDQAMPFAPHELSDAAILVVEDVAASRQLIGAILGAAGFTNIRYACDGEEALEKAFSRLPDLIILDIRMPGIDGYEVCRQVRARGLDMPILVQTGMQQPEERVEAFRAGASDIVAKPLYAGELVSRVQLHLEQRRLVAQLTHWRARMEDELRMAEGMQLSLLPDPVQVAALARGCGVRLDTHYAASNRLGGDLWQAFDLGDRRFAILLVDLSGHGVTAALNAFRLHTVSRTLTEARDEPGLWLEQLNREMAAVLPVAHFATGFYGVFDGNTGQLRFASAGAPPPLVMRGNGAWETLDTRGLLLGCRSEARYETRQLELARNDRLFLYSDALLEDFSAPDRNRTPAELAGWLAASADSALPGLCRHIAARAAEGRTAGLQDDLTLIAMEVGVTEDEAVEPAPLRSPVPAAAAGAAADAGPIGQGPTGWFSFYTLDQASDLSARVARGCPQPERVALGLLELLVNAIEHGNLAIGGVRKQELLSRGVWRDEIERRLRDPQYADRRAWLEVRRNADETVFVVRDEGAGFDHAAELARADRGQYRGRGLRLARDLCFSALCFCDQGRCVEARVAHR
ncbi:ATP-binding SpoIIE family protein phosphatase [Maricaulis sp. CAU 1757]